MTRSELKRRAAVALADLTVRERLVATIRAWKLGEVEQWVVPSMSREQREEYWDGDHLFRCLNVIGLKTFVLDRAVRLLWSDHHGDEVLRSHLDDSLSVSRLSPEGLGDGGDEAGLEAAMERLSQRRSARTDQLRSLWHAVRTADLLIDRAAWLRFRSEDPLQPGLRREFVRATQLMHKLAEALGTAEEPILLAEPTQREVTEAAKAMSVDIMGIWRTPETPFVSNKLPTYRPRTTNDYQP